MDDDAGLQKLNISRVQRCLSDDASTQALDNIFPQEAINMLLRGLKDVPLDSIMDSAVAKRICLLFFFE